MARSTDQNPERGGAYPRWVPFPAEPELTRDERLLVATAVEQFNEGRYFECHETLEGIWLKHRGPARDFLQGLIQVSVAFHHLQNGNRAGARRTFTRAMGRFAPYPTHYFGFDLATERAGIRARLAALDGGNLIDPGQSPRWSFEADRLRER